jgi:hypothetical protein
VLALLITIRQQLLMMVMFLAIINFVSMNLLVSLLLVVMDFESEAFFFTVSVELVLHIGEQ